MENKLKNYLSESNKKYWEAINAGDQNKADQLLKQAVERNNHYNKCKHEYNAISDYCTKCNEPIVGGHFE